MTTQEIISWLDRHVARTADLCLDTRQLRKGDVFFACPGLNSDGRQYIAQAATLGAAAIVVQSGDEVAAAESQTIPVLEVPDLMRLLGGVADIWYGEPSKSMSIVAVTGTNGKTSCVQWLAAALNAEGVPCATLGTLGASMPDGTRQDGALTTPDVLSMHRSLAAMREAGAHVVALEASSIGLVQGRLGHVHIDIAAFTNLTHDHLDYHHTFENYKRAKFELFNWPGLRHAVINADDPAGAELLDTLPPSLAYAYTTSRDHGDAAMAAHDIQTSPYGIVFNLVARDGTAQLFTRLVGAHNVSNLLLVASVLQALGWDVHKVARVLSTLESVEGRLQVVEPIEYQPRSGAWPLIVVDYAHTPDALERALESLRDAAKVRGGKLTCVFGCGGSRDSSKRPIMGRIASERADSVVLTNDNPRMEEPAAIVDQIMAGIAQGAVRVDLDRAHAILSTVWAASPNDVVLLAGKGHETYQESRGVRTAFDDREWARFALTWLHCAGLSTDSRNIRNGQMFLALKGESFDGHDYLEQVGEAGACAAIVEHRDESVFLPQLVLGDTRQALIRIATAWRESFNLPVIGVTGSNGKTTTKEMIASILREGVGEACTLATRGNLNNDIGVPLTILRLTKEHRAAVIELGMNHPGEIALLAAIAKPTVALVNNAQREHQEFMHTVEAVASENGAVLQALPAEGVAVFPGDDTYSALWSDMANGRKILRFGFEPHHEVNADHIHAEPARTVFQLNTPQGTETVTLSAPGLHNLRNALAAAACAVSAGVPMAAIVKGLEAFNPVAGRMQPRTIAGGFQLIDDTYNANPDSVRAAIDVLAQLKGTKILVLGDMAEVGANSDALHAEVGAYAAEKGIDLLFTLGPACAHSASAFGAQARSFSSVEDVVRDLAALLPANILVKGSRSARMERVLQALEQQLINHEEGARHAT